jgi:arylsulfatase A
MKPNILLVNYDDLGYGDLECYGSKVNRTPFIDALAKEGIIFTDFYSASPVCSPSRAALMTGCYPKRIGFSSFDGKSVLRPGDRFGLNPEETTIADILKEAGYATCAIGKWHCGDQPEFLPLNHGFDHYYGLPYSNDMGRQCRKRMGSMEELDRIFPPLPLMEDNEVIQEQPDQRGLIERYVEESIRFIRNNKDKPFFLYFAPLQVHLPLYAPERFVRESKNGNFGACVECVDWAVGTMVHELKKLGLYENTLIIITSDNGSLADRGASNGPLRGRKATTWEGGMRVPFIMHWKGVIKEGRVCRRIASNIDILPTLARLTGAEPDQTRVIDGVDMTPLLFENSSGEYMRDTLVYYHLDNLEAIRVGKWKLHFRKGDQEINDLYDLEADIGEMNNVYNEYPDIVKELNRIADQYRKDLGDKALNMEGLNIRPAGCVENPKKLTEYNPDYPYIIAIYDTEESG